MDIFLTFVLAVITYSINQKIQRLIVIKTVINTLFELFGSIENLKENDAKEVNVLLTSEIISLEKMHDSNKYVKKEIEKVRELRKIYYSFSVGETKENQCEVLLRNIKFEKLGRAFLILSFFNP